MQTYAGFTVGWVEATRGRSAEAIAICRRAHEQAPDRVSRAYASMILGWALLEDGKHLEALERLQPTVTEIEGFGFPQWQALTAVFAAEALRREAASLKPSQWSNAVLAWPSELSTGTRWDSLSAPPATCCAIRVFSKRRL